jgi:hypothetical protein
MACGREDFSSRLLVINIKKHRRYYEKLPVEKDIIHICRIYNIVLFNVSDLQYDTV